MSEAQARELVQRDKEIQARVGPMREQRAKERSMMNSPDSDKLQDAFEAAQKDPSKFPEYIETYGEEHAERFGAESLEGLKENVSSRMATEPEKEMQAVEAGVAAMAGKGPNPDPAPAPPAEDSPKPKRNKIAKPASEVKEVKEEPDKPKPKSGGKMTRAKAQSILDKPFMELKEELGSMSEATMARAEATKFLGRSPGSEEPKVRAAVKGKEPAKKSAAKKAAPKKAAPKKAAPKKAAPKKAAPKKAAPKKEEAPDDVPEIADKQAAKKRTKQADAISGKPPPPKRGGKAGGGSGN